jgi:molybdopterin-containing oxidoreductase family iron-sulfur binding subunit
VRSRPQTAAALGVEDGDVVSLTTETGKLELPAFVQPGQERRTISVALGYGRWAAGKAGDGVGANAFALARVENGVRRRRRGGGRDDGAAGAAGARADALLDGGGDIVQELRSRSRPRRRTRKHSLSNTNTIPRRLPESVAGAAARRSTPGACRSISTRARLLGVRRRVPVGEQRAGRRREQVRKSRIMHWLRIDRYFDGDGGRRSSVHQPMMCQHCEHAPCETVCPVLATTHQLGGHQPAGLQPLHRHALLRQQLPVQGPPLQLAQLHARTRTSPST